MNIFSCVTAAIVAFAIALTVVVGGFLAEQANLHTFYGVVRDSNGAALPGCAVEYLHAIPGRNFTRGAGTTERRTVTADKWGRFSIRCPASIVQLEHVEWKGVTRAYSGRPIQLMNDSAVPTAPFADPYRPNPLKPFELVMPQFSNATADASRAF